jgi:thiol-disulfide isomerase/thioredoxin
VTNPRTIALGLAVAILALSAGYATHRFLEGDIAQSGLSDAEDVASLWKAELTGLDGQRRSVAHWKGSILVVNFWATWCAPCREEIPEFVRLQQDLAGKGVQFVGIAADQPDQVRRFVSELKVNYPILVGGMDVLDLSAKLGNRISALPFTVVIDPNGHVAHRQLGVLKPLVLRGVVDQLR